MLPKKDHSSSTDNHNAIKQKALLNEIHFAKISSYCALIATGISTMIIFYGIFLVLQGQITTGTLTSVGSFIATNRRVDRLLKDD